MCKKIFICPVIVLFVLTSCGVATQNSSDEEWKAIVQRMKGSHISRVVQALGPPNDIVSDHAGGKIYIWGESHTKTVPQYDLEIVPQRSEPSYTTKGELYWNPILQQWEWKSTTKPNPIRPVLLPRVQRKFSGYRTESYGYSIMIYANSDGIIYHGIKKDW